MDYHLLNEDVKQKASGLKPKLIGSIKGFNMKHVESPTNTESLTDLKITTASRFGLLNKIRVRFKKSGVMRHKGVGRGTTASQVGSTNRTPAEWFNPVVEEFADDLVEFMADKVTDLVLNSIQIK